jgi:hypothetical protein
MDLEYVPLLSLQRELYEIPRGRDRFEAYLTAMLNETRDDVRLAPLGVMNPMAREHVAARLDEWLALDTDAIGAEALAEVSGRLNDVPGAFRIGLVIADDARGGWTNRYAVTYANAFEDDATRKRHWLSALLWSSEPASTQAARESVLLSVFRAVHIQRHGPTKTLRDRLAQEGYALAMAGCDGPTLDPDDLEYTRDILAPLLDAEDRRTGIECLYGDRAARSLGLTPRGLSDDAGLALALAEARRDLNPEGHTWKPV